MVGFLLFKGTLKITIIERMLSFQRFEQVPTIKGYFLYIRNCYARGT